MGRFGRCGLTCLSRGRKDHEHNATTTHVREHIVMINAGELGLLIAEAVNNAPPLGPLSLRAPGVSFQVTF